MTDDGSTNGKDEGTLLQRAVSRLEFEIAVGGALVPTTGRREAAKSVADTSPPQRATPAKVATANPGKGNTGTANAGIANAGTADAGGPEPSRRAVVPAPEEVTMQLAAQATAESSTAYKPHDEIASLIPDESPLHEMSTLDEVAEYVASTILTPLDETRLNPVFGVGDPAADLLVIGEAPGAEEDKKGEPFVGRAGQLLDKILLAIGFERGDVYIANILKSRPPNNRNPSPIEVAAHLPVLLKQILLIQPKLILCVGRTAGTSLLGVESSLSALRGAFHDYHGIPVLVTYHPAALLRNPKWKPATWEDVKSLRARYDELGGTTNSDRD